MSIIYYFNANGNTVFVAALDISKAFDAVNPLKLFSSLIEAGNPSAGIRCPYKLVHKIICC